MRSPNTVTLSMIVAIFFGFATSIEAKNMLRARCAKSKPRIPSSTQQSSAITSNFTSLSFSFTETLSIQSVQADVTSSPFPSATTSTEPDSPEFTVLTTSTVLPTSGGLSNALETSGASRNEMFLHEIWGFGLVLGIVLVV